MSLPSRARDVLIAACLLQCGETERGAAYLTLLQDRQTNHGTFDAAFVADPEGFYRACARTRIGPCTKLACPANQRAMLLDAGTLALSGGPIAGDVRLSPDADNYYATDLGGLYTFRTGDAFTVVGSGADVGAFSVRVTMPAPITLTRLDLTNALPTTDDLEISWSGAESDASVIVQVIDDTQTTCTFDASSGAAIIPRAAIAAFAGHTTTLQWQKQRDAVVYAGSFPVHLLAVVTNSARVRWK